MLVAQVLIVDLVHLRLWVVLEEAAPVMAAPEVPIKVAVDRVDRSMFLALVLAQVVRVLSLFDIEDPN
jgi:hypothetical protein